MKLIDSCYISVISSRSLLVTLSPYFLEQTVANIYPFDIRGIFIDGRKHEALLSPQLIPLSVMYAGRGGKFRLKLPTGNKEKRLNIKYGLEQERLF